MADLPALDFTPSPEFSGAANAASAAESPYDAALRIFRENAARRAAWQSSNAVPPEALARANSFGSAPSVPVAPSVAAGENLAPLATAAENAPTWGARLLASPAGRFGARFLGPAGLLYGAAQTGLTAGRMLTPDNLATGMADAVGRIGQSLGFDNGYAGGSAQVKAADALPPASGPAPASPAPAAPVPSATPTNPAVRVLNPADASAAVGQFFDGSAVPADGTGYIRNNSTGEVVQTDSRGIAPGPTGNARRVQVPVVVNGETGPTAHVPTFGSAPSFYSNLDSYMQQLGPYALSQAQATRGVKYGQKQQELDTKSADSAANRQNQADTVQANHLKAIADVLRANTDAKKESKTVIPGFEPGTALIVDRDSGTAKQVSAPKPPTWEQFRDSARQATRAAGKPNPTDDQLKTYYTKTYGGG